MPPPWLSDVGNEKTWWANHGIDPLKVADELWAFTLRGEQIEASDSDKISSDLPLDNTGASSGHVTPKQEINGPLLLR